MLCDPFRNDENKRAAFIDKVKILKRKITQYREELKADNTL